MRGRTEVLSKFKCVWSEWETPRGAQRACGRVAGAQDGPGGSGGDTCVEGVMLWEAATPLPDALGPLLPFLLAQKDFAVGSLKK